MAERTDYVIAPDTTGHQLSLLLTGLYTRIGSYWVWQVDDTIHISDAIGGIGGDVHKVGGMRDKLSEFRDANGMTTGRQELVDAGYSVVIEGEELLVMLDGEVVYSRMTDGDLRYYDRYMVRGWRVARRLHNGEDGMRVAVDEEQWWVKEERVEPAEPPDYFRMTQDELRRL